MPSSTPKQQRFFQAVKRAKHDPSYGNSHIRKVADSMTSSDIDAFAGSVAELRIKKAVLSILKDIKEPMYLNEDQEMNPVSKKFNVKDKFENYVKKYLGQPFLPKEMEAINNFEQAKPIKIERTQIRFETTDEFNNSTSTAIKKLKEGNQFIYTAFTKISKAEPEPEDEQPPMSSEPPSPSEPSTPEAEPTAQPTQPVLDDIIVSKSIPFTDEIKGGAILAEFLKKLDI